MSNSNYKLGIGIVSCDRGKFLEETILSLYKNKISFIGCVVDNGIVQKNITKDVANKYKFDYIDGEHGNSPHGQNLCFEYLKNCGCDFILKSDDDILYGDNYLDILFQTILDKDGEIAGIGGECWSKNMPDIIFEKNGRFFTPRGRDISHLFLMYRTNFTTLVNVKWLYGGFIYNVEDAEKLKLITLSDRGGPFGEYFSRIAFREETEFTCLLKYFSGKKMLFNPNAKSFHYSAPGGIRIVPDSRNLRTKDHAAAVAMLCKYSSYNAIPLPFEGYENE